MLVALSFCSFAVQSGDVLMYLSLARDFILTGRWAETADPYLYSLSGTPLIWLHEYLSYLVFYGFHWLLEVPGLILLKVILWGSIFALTLAAPKREAHHSLLWMLAWMLAVVAASFRFIERASLFSDLICVWLAKDLLVRTHIDRRWLWTLAGVFLIWIQLHPGFPMGLGLLGLWGLWRVWQQQMPAWDLRFLLLPIAALMVNPKGLEGVLYPFRFALNEAQVLKKYNFEWMPAYHPLFRSAPETLAFWLLAALSLFLLWRQRRTMGFERVLIPALVLVGTLAIRFVPWVSFALLICIKPWCQLVHVRPRVWAYGCVIILLIGLSLKNLFFGYTASSGDRLPEWRLDPKIFPLKTVEFLQQKRIAGQLYNTHDFGAFLVWSQNTPIFHHGFVTNMPFYENDVIGVFRSQQRFLQLAARYNWTMLLVDKHGAYKHFYKFLSPLPQWKIVAEDPASYLIYLLPN